MFVAAGLTLAPLLPQGYCLQAATTESGENSLFEDALSRFNNGDIDGAIIQLKNVLQQNPANLAARILIGKSYLQRGNAEQAEKELRRALVSSPPCQYQ
jgi:Tfp pilus assembly protein PilF